MYFDKRHVPEKKKETDEIDSNYKNLEKIYEFYTYLARYSEQF